MIKVIYSGIFLIITINLGGCLGCMLKGIGAHECGRIDDRNKGIENRKNKLKILNTNFNITDLGNKMSRLKKLDIEKRFCTKYKDKQLPISNNLAKDFNINLSSYSVHNFCLIYYKNSKLEMYEKETQSNENEGYVSYYLIDNQKVYAFLQKNIFYTKKGYKYGVAYYK